MEKILDALRDAWVKVVDVLPEISLAIIVFFIGHWIIRFIRRNVSKKIIRKSGESLTAAFTSDIVGFILHVLLIAFCLNVIGFSSFTNKLVAGAGLSAFIIGFALKDIGENFLSGIIMVFNRPFRNDDIIEIDGHIGNVVRISLRETVMKSLDGKDVFIPNADILKKPLINYTVDDILRISFNITIFNSNDIEAVMQLIVSTIHTFEVVLHHPKPSVEINHFNDGVVHLKVNFWYSLAGGKSMDNDLRTAVMLKVFNALKAHKITIPHHPFDEQSKPGH